MEGRWTEMSPEIPPKSTPECILKYVARFMGQPVCEHREIIMSDSYDPSLSHYLLRWRREALIR